MVISDSYLAHLVTIAESQAIYHPRLPAPLPSSVYAAQSRARLEPTVLSVTPGVLPSAGSSRPAGIPRSGLVEIEA